MCVGDARVPNNTDKLSWPMGGEIAAFKSLFQYSSSCEYGYKNNGPVCRLQLLKFHLSVPTVSEYAFDGSKVKQT